MQRRPPSPSPGPGWEALKETPTTDSSGEEDEITDDTDIADARSTFRSQPPLKRKEAEQLGSTSKRPRHEHDRRQSEGDLGNSGSTSASGVSRQKWPQNNNAVASTSKTAAAPTTAVNKSMATGPSSASSSMPPPPLPKRAGTDDSNTKRLSLPRPRPIPKSIKSSQTTATSSKSISQVLDTAGGSSPKKKVILNTVPSDFFGRTATSQAGPSSGKRSISSNDAPRSQAQRRKSQPASNEVIDLCLDDSPPAPPKPKARSSLPNPIIDMSDEDNAVRASKKKLARKSVGGKAPQKRAPKSSNEVIEISSDSDDEPSKPASSKSLSKQGEKRTSISRPGGEALPKKQTGQSGSKSANESDSMKVDESISAVSTRPQQSTSTTIPAAMKVSKSASSDAMQVDSLVPARPSSSIHPATQARQTISSNLTKPPSQVASSSRATLVAPVQPPVARIPFKRPSSQNMQVDERATAKSAPSIPPSTNASSGQTSSSTSNLSKPSIPRPNLAAQKVISDTASKKQESSIASSSHSTSISNPSTQFKRRQVAVKSSGALKYRPQGFSSSSPGSAGNGSDSDDEQDKAGSPSTPNSPEASSTDGGVDMRDMDHALGLVASISYPATPERTTPIKEQPISPEISQSAKGKTKQNAQSSQRLPPISTSQTAANLQHRGDTVESAIDLTSDNEDTLMGDLTSLVANSQKLVNTLSKWKGKGRALPSSPTPPPHLVTPRSGTDELLLRPSEPEPSPPPISPSPPVKSPFVPIPDLSQTNQESRRIKVLRKQQPAPLIVARDPSLSESQVPPLKPPGVLSITLKPEPLAIPQIQSPSLVTKDQTTLSVTSGGNLQAAGLASKSISPMPSTAETTELQSSGNTPQAKPPLLDSARSSPVMPAKETVTSLAGLSSNEPETFTTQNAANDNTEAVANTSDVEMQDDESDHNAMQETEEVQALVEEDDEDFYESEELSRSRFDNSNEAGPSDSSFSTEIANKRSSRRSSRSSTSAASRVASDDEIIPQEFESASRNTTPDDGPTSAKPHGKTLGGFPAITWKEFRQDLRNFTPKCFYAKDLPHALQDHINTMSEYTRKMPAIRDVFQAMIQENTIENEPLAPPIELFNDIDDEPTPPWEFHYTNEMWHGEGVPAPDIKNVTSCTCKGACNPKSKTCACLKRQREALGDPNAEFMYDKAGRLRTSGYPINECNDLCGCGDECRNRVVQHGRKVQINIKKTEHKGWGVFAGSKKIYKGSFIGIYSGELLTDADAHERGINYNKFGRTYLFDLDFHHLREHTADQDGWTSKFTVDAYHAGNFTRFLNHSCDPNCTLQPLYINEGNLEKPLLVIFSERDIEPYEEICFNYSGESDEVEEEPDEPGSPSKTDKIYARCMCGAHNCTGNMFKPPAN